MPSRLWQMLPCQSFFWPWITCENPFDLFSSRAQVPKLIQPWAGQRMLTAQGNLLSQSWGRMEFRGNLRSVCYYGYGSVVGDLKLGVERERTKVSGLPEVESVWEDDIMIGECELNIVLIDAKDIAESRTVQLLEEHIHAGQYLLKKV